MYTVIGCRVRARQTVATSPFHLSSGPFQPTLHLEAAAPPAACGLLARLGVFPAALCAGKFRWPCLQGTEVGPGSFCRDRKSGRHWNLQPGAAHCPQPPGPAGTLVLINGYPRFHEFPLCSLGLAWVGLGACSGLEISCNWVEFPSFGAYGIEHRPLI